jgi:hypothetical protein
VSAWPPAFACMVPHLQEDKTIAFGGWAAKTRILVQTALHPRRNARKLATKSEPVSVPEWESSFRKMNTAEGSTKVDLTQLGARML